MNTCLYLVWQHWGVYWKSVDIRFDLDSLWSLCLLVCCQIFPLCSWLISDKSRPLPDNVLTIRRPLSAAYPLFDMIPFSEPGAQREILKVYAHAIWGNFLATLSKVHFNKWKNAKYKIKLRHYKWLLPERENLPISQVYARAYLRKRRHASANISHAKWDRKLLRFLSETKLMKTVFDQSTHETGEKINNSLSKQHWKNRVKSLPGIKTENKES